MLRVDPSAVADNWRTFARIAAPAESAAVVKADAYGLGAVPIARALVKAGARTVFTATLAEARVVREALGPGPAIIALSGLEAGPAGFVEAAITPTVNSAEEAAAWAGRGACVVHLDTGMSRLGAPPEEDAAIRAALGASAPAMVMSHLACAGDPDHPMNPRQRQRFLDRAPAFGAARLSLSATGGSLLGAGYAFDLVRIGVGLYGGGVCDSEPPLRPAARLTAPVLQLREIPAGESVGYDATFIAPRPTRIATLGIGYADGVLRSLSARGYAVLAGRACPILGRISMDYITIDVTELAAAAVRIGDEAELLGPAAPLAEVAARAGTASYEVLTSLGRVRRAYGPLSS